MSTMTDQHRGGAPALELIHAGMKRGSAQPAILEQSVTPDDRRRLRDSGLSAQTGQCPEADAGMRPTVVTKAPELPLQQGWPPSGLPKFVSISAL